MVGGTAISTLYSWRLCRSTLVLQAETQPSGHALQQKQAAGKPAVRCRCSAARLCCVVALALVAVLFVDMALIVLLTAALAFVVLFVLLPSIRVLLMASSQEGQGLLWTYLGVDLLQADLLWADLRQCRPHLGRPFLGRLFLGRLPPCRLTRGTPSLGRPPFGRPPLGRY